MKIPKTLSNEKKEVLGAVYTVRVVPYLETRWNWQTEQRETEDNPEFIFSIALTQPTKGQEGQASGTPARKVTQRLLAVENDAELLEFFKEFGPLQITMDNQIPSAAPSRLSQVRSLRKSFIERLSTPTGEVTPDEKIRKDLFDWYADQPLQMKMYPQTPFVALAACNDVQECLRATYFLDSLYKFGWGFCAREGCGKPFWCGSKHKRIYCGPRCARHQAQINYLKNPKPEAAKAKKGSSNGNLSSR